MKNRRTSSFHAFAALAAVALLGAAPRASAALDCDYSAAVPLEMELGSTEIYTVDVYRDTTAGSSAVQATSSNPNIVAVSRSVVRFATGSDQITFTFNPRGLGTATITLTGTSGSEAGETLSFVATVTSGNVLSLAYSDAFPCNMVEGEERDFVASIVGNTTKTWTIQATSSDSSVVTLQNASKSIPAGSDNVTFTLVAGAQGTATVSVSVADDPASVKTFPVNVAADPNGTRIMILPEELRFAEGGNVTNFTIRLGSKVTATKTLQLNVQEAGYADHLVIPASVTVPAGANFRTVSVTGLDGGFDFTVRIHDPDGDFEDGILQGSVLNVDPEIGGSHDPETPQEIGALRGAPTEIYIDATDVPSDEPTLVYHWSISSETTGTITNRLDTDGQVISVYATDKDGGRSDTAYFVVRLDEASRIIFRSEDNEGNRQVPMVIDPAGRKLDHAKNPWTIAGNDFYASSSTSVQPILPRDEQGNLLDLYPFGWWFPDDTDGTSEYASTTRDLQIPNFSTDPIGVNTPDSGVITLTYLYSHPYQGYRNQLTGQPIDRFGDFDQDGLSDKWEAEYLDRESAPKTFANPQLAVTTSTGKFGSSGTVYSGGSFNNTDDTADNDRLPTALLEEIDNVWAGDPNINTNEGAVNKVRVFLYPLDGNYIDYGTHVGIYDSDDRGGLLEGWATANGRVYDPMSSRRDPTAKPFFSNIQEFRGLPQTSDAISADIEKAPNWVAWGYPGILSRTNLYARGNCPGTDPTVADTDGDGFEDGWEYYFWTTLLYENKPEFWRAYDPTLVLYPTLAPGGSSDFRATGYPLLRRPLDTYQVTNGVYAAVAETNVTKYVAIDDWDAFQTTWTVTNYSFSAETFVAGGGKLYDGGLYVRYPDQEFQVELIRNECYYGNPVLDPTTREEGSVNYLTNAPVASTPYYDADQDPENDPPHAAVEFTIGENGFTVYTREGYVDEQGRAKLFYTPIDGEAYNGSLSDFWNSAWPTKLEPGEIPGAYVDFLTGYFCLPGYDYYPPHIQALIGDRNAKAKARYRTMNGLFPKQWLVNQFDPRSEENGLMPDIAEPDFDAILTPLGLSTRGWNPRSDLDGDGVTDYEEYYLGTNPIHWDTDNDGMPDGWEVLFGLDPHDRSDASSNTDCDRMFAVGPYRHADAFLYHYFNETYWNGQQSLGFVPGAASAGSRVRDLPFTALEEFYMQKWMMGKAGRDLIFLECIYPAQWLDGNGRCLYTTNPRNDDSNEDHIPDGWALYAGYIPVPGVDLIDHVWGPLHDFFPPICPDDLRPDPDGDGLQWRQEYDNWVMAEARQSQIDNEVYLEEEQDSYHPATWFEPAARDWTNKTRPTSPWIADTDGDGLSDATEYKEDEYDWNGDGNALANFDPTTADTRFDRLPDSWHYLTGLYDTSNAVGAGTMGPFGPYGDPDGDGLPNYMEYLAGTVYAWRYDKWYSPDDKSLWQPDIMMAGYSGLPSGDPREYLQEYCAEDNLVAAKYSLAPIVSGGVEARRFDPHWDPEIGPWDEEGNDPGLPVWEDAYPYGKSVHFQPYRPSDFLRAAPSPHSVNAIVRTINVLETRWVNTITNIPKVLLGIDAQGNPQIGDGPAHVATGWGRDQSPTMGDLEKTYEDPTFVVSPIANYIQRAWALMNDRKRRQFPDTDPVTGELKDTAFITVDEYYILFSAISTLTDYFYSYGASPAPWEPGPASDTIQYVDIDIPVVWRFLTPNYAGVGGLPTLAPRDPDSDHDGMDDYWEIYHGLNPLYGGSPQVGKAGSYPDSDRGDLHPYGNGSKRDWVMAYGEAATANNRVLKQTELGPTPVKREDAAFHTPLTGQPIAEAAHFDYCKRPWLAGDRFADPDQDGLSNQEESYNYLLNDVLHHTDPSPYWFTDPTYVESIVGLYYAVDGELGSLYWWWDKPVLGTLADGPTYLYDFEINEGFDTDNDNISDREELTQTSSSGITDPLDLDSPRNRKALYFNGHAAARTAWPYYHDKFSLTSFTVEFWIRPEALPAPGKRQTLVQRPVFMPVDDSSGATHWQVRNNFLVQIDELGRIHGRVDNDALETVSSATAISAGRLVPGHWAHVALVMDSVGDRLTLYVNGEYAAGVGAGLKPCTGGLFGYQWLTSQNGSNPGGWESANLYDYSPAPIVLGANDRNPWGVVGGVHETYPWGPGRGIGSSGAAPDFDPDQFFTGWMDEVRIWDRDRSQTEIKNNMTRRFTKADIEAVNRKRLAWELQAWAPDKVGTNLVAATAASAWPQKLLYHYSFDNLPDTIAVGRDNAFADYFRQDSAPYPAGWQSDTVAGYRPTPFWTAPWWYHYADTVLPNLVPWWYTAKHRSNVYDDYSYVPWIENTVAHMPQTPALDMKGVFPNWNESTWTVTSYRQRGEMDWLNDALGPVDFAPHRQDDVVPAKLPASGSADVDLTRIKNTMNPYVMFYRTAVSATEQVSPSTFAGKLDTYGRYAGIPVLSDMLPLMDAVADVDVELWDGRGRGTDLEGIDTDGDGLPDWWEIAHGLDFTDATGVNGAYGDSDGDGLDNWAEYLAHTNPFSYDSDDDGYSDYFARPDGQSLTYGELYDDSDGMDNVWEEKYGLDPNRYDGTEDADADGWTNWEEFMAGTDPSRADDFPEPNFSVTFHYSGENWYTSFGSTDSAGTGTGNSALPYVYSYSEKTAGRKMGGYADGKYQSLRTEHGTDIQARLYPDTWKPGTTIDDFTVRIGLVDETFDWIADLDSFPIGTALVTLYTQLGTLQTFQVNPYTLDPKFGLISESGNTGWGTGLTVLQYSTGRIYDKGGSYAGIDTVTYSVSGRAFPYTIHGMHRMATGSHDHMMSGYNRFVGWLDLDGNEEWSPGEPMGLSQPRPTLVSWDSVETTVPLSDSVWDYPRVSWPAISSGSEYTYFVDFSWVRGSGVGTGVTGAKYSVTGDWDNDGLEDWMEALAFGSNVVSRAGSTNDWFTVDPVTGFFYGELYDDGDGMPTAWEMKYGLDPYRFDANLDLDDDGWSNLAEFMAGSDPSSAASYPRPKFSVTFDYSGKQTDLYSLGVYSYGDKTQRGSWGGSFDGRYTSTKGFSYGVTLGSDGTVTLDKYSDVGAQGTFSVNNLAHGLIESASINVYVQNAEGAWETRSFSMTQINPGMGLFTQDDMGWILIEIESGRVLVTGDYVGASANVSTTVKSYSFPVTFSSLIRNPVGKHTHMIQGPNKFFGWMDLDGNEQYDLGEPAGISLHGATLVDWESTSIEIPLTDSLWDYPRISWAASGDSSAATSSTNDAEQASSDTDASAVPADTEAYFVTFSWSRGVSPQSGRASYAAITGDADGDGLEDWMEALAFGSNVVSRAGSTNDWYAVDPVTGFFYGELYDDGDGMPTAWETRYGLDPYRFDAQRDKDDDGWSNWAEFMAGTDPSNADDFPEPSLDTTFYYTGTVNGSSVLKVQTWSERLHGRYPGANGSGTVNMAGPGDSRYTTASKLVGTFGMPYYSGGVIYYYIANAMGVTFDVSDTGAPGVRSATLSYYRDGSLETYELQEFNDDYGYFVDDDKDHIFFEYDTGYMLSRSGEKLTEDDELRGRWYRFEFTPAAKSYPFTVKNMTRDKEGGHPAEGGTRFMGFMDLNSNGTWDEGEPMGLSTEGTTLLGWDSVAAEIALSDSLWDYPRIQWTEAAGASDAAAPSDGAWYVTFEWDRGVSSESGAGSFVAITGDTDGDGLEDWAERLAEAAGASVSSVTGSSTNDWFRIDPETGLYLGERHDDGDGMPSAWETSYGLDPYRFDAQLDKDDDGWSNWAEFMAGTDPANPDDFPAPTFDVTFRYTGMVDGVSNLKVLPYGTSVHGIFPGSAEVGAGPGSAAVMGGASDGIYIPINNSIGLWNDRGTVDALDTTWGSSWIGQKNITEATIYAYVDGQEQSYTAVPFNENREYGYFVMDDKARIFIRWADGLVLTQFFDQETGLASPISSNISNPYSMPYRATFTTAGKEFPMTISGLSLDDSTVTGHMVEGPNRFLGLMDLNGNGTWDAGEPMGLSLGGATRVGWETVSAEIPLTDSLWGFPRVAWEASPIDDPVYMVEFKWTRGSAGYETVAGTSWNGVTGDLDSDGLEDWMEELAFGSNVVSTSGVDIPDWYKIDDPGTGFFYGELYDDGDGMPTSWELKYGLDPYRYDGNVDTDDDGWSNYAEFMAGTDPTSATSYPKPKFSVTFDYHGQETDLYSLGVYSYGRSTQGDTWGGSFDGRYTSTKGFSYGRYLGSDGEVTLDEYSDVGAQGTFAVTKLDHGLIESATINVYVQKEDGTTETRTFTMGSSNGGSAVFTQDDMGWILIEIESGRVLVYGDYVGQWADIHTQVRSYAFPITFSSLIRNPVGNHTHMVEGPNRFLGWMDLDGNGEYDDGEPMGLSLYGPTLVGWDSTAVEIPLTDSLWGYPRVSWNGPAAVSSFTPTHYVVTFRWAGESSSGEDGTNRTSTVTSGYEVVYGDTDGDGLDDYQELLAGFDASGAAVLSTNDMFSADSTTNRLDYDALDPATGLTWGEQFDDGDLMPAQWEAANNLDPDRFDADLDADDDGWTNYEEYRGSTWPGVARSFPMPVMELEYLYAGERVTNRVLVAQTYSERKQGTFLDGNASKGIYMGGLYDGKYATARNYNAIPAIGASASDDYGEGSFIVADGILGEDGVQTVQNVELGVSYIPQARIPRSSSVTLELLDISDPDTVVASGLLGTAVRSGDTMGIDLSGLNGEIGVFQLQSFFAFSVTNEAPLPAANLTVAGKTPVFDGDVPRWESYYNFVDTSAGTNATVVMQFGCDWASGRWGFGSAGSVSPEIQYYRQLAFFKYETGAVLNWGAFKGYAYRITSGDSIDGFIFPVTVGAWYRDDGTPNPVASWYQADEGAHTHAAGGFNRILGFSDVNLNGSWDPGEPMGLSLYNAVLAGPDSFKATIPLTDELFGFPRISWPASTNALVTRYVVHFYDSTGNAVTGDKGIVVESPRTFLHEGDWLEAGVNGLNFGTKTGDKFTWKVMGRTDNGFADQLVDQGSMLASLVPNSGSRRPMKAVSPVAESTVYGSLVEFKWEMDWRTEGVFFTVKDSSGTPVAGLNNLYVPLPVRHNKITDDDYYYSYIPQLENGRSIVSLPSGTYTYTIKPNIRSTASTFTAEKNGISGSFTIDNEENDSRLRASIKGHVHYYGRLPEADVPGKVVVQAYKVSNRARTSLSVGGSPVARTTANADGSFELTGLEAGTYGVVGWVDDDGDGVADATETQGFGFLGQSASPIQVPAWCVPLSITNATESVNAPNAFVAVDLEDVHVVLRDRDTDGDGVPNGAGFPTGGTLASRKAAYGQMALRTFPSAVPDGFDWISPSLFSTNKIVNTRTSYDYVGGTAGQTGYVSVNFLVKAPRTFLHEGDFASGGYFGFDLGKTNEIDVTWTVKATDGHTATSCGGGSFSVWSPCVVGAVSAETGAAGVKTNETSIAYRRPMKARWPTQMTVVRDAVVDFEWEMDEHTAGVDFTIEGVDDPSFSTNVFVPFPVMHWDPSVKCYYYKAKPQLEDGLRFLALPDGAYRYTIKERTRSDMIPAQSVTETFQVKTDENTRTLGSVEGDIWYFGRSMEEGTPPTWGDAPLHVQAYRVSDASSSSASVGGQLASDQVRSTNGAFRIPGLKAGTYTVFAFVDSNGNGVADDWETQGFGVFGGNASPVVIPASSSPIVVTNGASVSGLNVVLHDRDTDGDMLPDVWEWSEYGGLALHNGYEGAVSNAYVSLAWSEDIGLLTNWMWQATNVVTREIQRTDGLRVLIDEPRTFLHEGDLLAPYELKDRTPTGSDVPGNRTYRVWRWDMFAADWIPQDEPVYGFELGSFTNIVVNWSVTASNGVISHVVAESAFQVAAATDDDYLPARPRYPVQNAEVRSSVVEFEWTMDNRTAGVDFKLWKVSGPDASPAPADLVAGMTIPLPVRHWDAAERCYYWTARPQQEDGLRFLDLEDGWYVYEISTRPQTSELIARPRTIRERFRMNKGEASRVAGSIAGAVRYFGRSMDDATKTWPADLHVQAWKVGDSAATSATAAGGILAADVVTNANAAFSIGGLEPGAYSVFAFVDSNGNGLPDDWETQGYGVFGGSASPVVVPGSAPPVVVTNSAAVTGVNVVLHDRDTDGDKLPDAWEWKQYGSLEAHNGAEAGVLADYVSVDWNDPAAVVDWSWPIDWTQVIRRAAATAVKETLRVRVDASRTFLHEGDLLAPYILRDATAADTPENRFYRVWRGQEIGGVRSWIPQTEPYAGFELGAYSNVVVKWTVEARDGDKMSEVADGEFSIATVAGEARTPARAVYPTDNTPVRTGLVEFEWTMDEHNAGVVFDLWKVDGPEGGDLEQLVSNRLVALPVRHWDSAMRCSYWTAKPQLGDGSTMLELEDGCWYRWSVTTRPRSKLVAEETVGGRFRMAKAEPSRFTASIAGDIRYFGRAMETNGAGEAVWPADLHVQARRVGAAATTSASVGGSLAADQVRRVNGAFRLDGLEAGTYTVFAFVDSNENGLADDWETQGYGVFGGTASAVVVPGAAPPIVVTNGIVVSGVNVVLHDRDVDGDMLPDAWEWSYTDSLTDANGWQAAASNAYVSLGWSEGEAAVTNWSWPIDWTQVLRTAAASSVKESLRVRVDAPRTFLHEGDLLVPYILRDVSPEVGDVPSNRSYRLWDGEEIDGVTTWVPRDEPFYGFELGAHSNVVVEWTVVERTGTEMSELGSGSFEVVTELGDARMPLVPRYPVQNASVRTSVVKFEWLMDRHNAGVVFDLWRMEDATGTNVLEAVVTNLVVAMPVMHWDPLVKCYYWTAEPQMEDGLRFVDLPDGFYRYRIATRPQTDLIEPETFVERFRVARGAPARDTGSISGQVRYFGRSMDDSTDPPTWGDADLHVRAYLASDESTTSASAGGMILAESVQKTNGAFRLEGLKAGTYSVYAFVDSNGNGIADDWETQGIGVYGGNASAVVVPSASPPIVVTNGASVVDVNVVLHDRDTDGDRLPDVFEWAWTNSLSAVDGYDAGALDVYTNRLWSEGVDAATNWIWRIDEKTVVTRTVDIPETAYLRVRVDGPRNFLHEGDLLTPWIYRNKRKDLAAEGVEELAENRIPYLWTKTSAEGDNQWTPLQSPYYGFDMGSYTNVQVNWSVEVWNGAQSYPGFTSGVFNVISTPVDRRRPLMARYPTQLTKVEGNLVEFEWEMDEANAGVIFNLWKLEGPEAWTNGTVGASPAYGDQTGLTRIQVITNMVVAFPIGHGRPGTDGRYFSAVPQTDDGVQLADKTDPDSGAWTPDIGKRFVSLPGDGLYEYTIEERPRVDSSTVKPQILTERFQLDNSGESRSRYSIEGDIRYFGKVMQRVPVAELGETDGAAKVLRVNVDTNLLHAGAMGVLLVRPSVPSDGETSNNWESVESDGSWAEEAFNDSKADGVLYPAGTGTYKAWSGTVDYGTGDLYLQFDEPPAAGLKVLLVEKRFPTDLVLQAFKLADEAGTAVSVAGVPVYQEVRRAKGRFLVPNLVAGSYAVRAFVDSNGNGYADDWETQGVAVRTGTVSPNLDAGSEPIIVNGNVTGLMIVLHDRDTDNDLLPDSWEWWKSGGSLLVSGYDISDAGGLLWFQEYADGALDSDPRTPDTDLDGLTDAMEILVTGTDTHLKDTDGDGVGDLEEFLAGSNPLDPADAGRYMVPALEFDEAGVPFVDIAYPALKPGVVLTYELQRKESLADGAWETVAEFEAKNDGGGVIYYSTSDGANTHMSRPGTARMLPADQAGTVDFSTGFFRIRIFADYGRMVDNGDGTWSYWTWVRTGPSAFEYKEAARGTGTLVRDAAGNWTFVKEGSSSASGTLRRDPAGNWTFED